MNPDIPDPSPASREAAQEQLTIKEQEVSDFMQRYYKAKPSLLGCRVIQILSEIFKGKHHMTTELRKTDWQEPHCIQVNVRRTLSTYDFSDLTCLVVLCHDLCIRCEISACAPGVLRLFFTQRKKDGDFFSFHPPIESAIEKVRRQAAASLEATREQGEEPKQPLRVPQTPSTGIGAIFGKLETDESDEEIQKELENLS